jgi:hypothetical protein
MIATGISSRDPRLAVARPSSDPCTDLKRKMEQIEGMAIDIDTKCRGKINNLLGYAAKDQERLDEHEKRIYEQGRLIKYAVADKETEKERVDALSTRVAEMTARPDWLKTEAGQDWLKRAVDEAVEEKLQETLRQKDGPLAKAWNEAMQAAVQAADKERKARSAEKGAATRAANKAIAAAKAVAAKAAQANAVPAVHTDHGAQLPAPVLATVVVHGTPTVKVEP